MTDTEYVSRAEAAALLGMSPRQFDRLRRQLQQAGEPLPTWRVSGHSRVICFPLTAVARLKERPVTPVVRSHGKDTTDA